MKAIGNNMKFKQKIIRKKKIVIGFVTFLIVAVAFILFFCAIGTNSNIKDEDVIAYFKGESIYYGEYLLFVERIKSEVTAYIVNKYKVEIDKDFWEKSFSGEVPLEMVKNRTLDELKKYKSEQVLLKENGIVNDISYKAFYESFIAENERRDTMKSSGKAYGTEQFDVKSYITYQHSNRMSELKNKMIKGGTNVSNIELQNFYETLADKSSFKEVDTLKIKKIGINFDDDIARDDATDILSKLKAKLEGKTVIKGEIESPAKENKNFFISDVVVDNKSYKNYRLGYEYISPAMQPGQTSQVTVDYNKKLVFFYLCTERIAKGYKPVAEIRDALLERYFMKKIENEVIKIKNKYKLEINHGIYDRIF